MLKTYTNKMTEHSYDMAEEPLNSALFTTGNGYMGIRGSFEEFGSLRIQGAYIRGVIDEIVEIVEPFCDNEYMKHYYIDETKLKHFETQESIINFADILLLRFEIAGETFYPWEGEILEWERSLDASRACLIRNVTWKSPKGLVTKFAFERFASSDNDHVYCIKVDVTPVNHSSQIKVISGVDTRVKTNGQHIATTEKSSAEGNVSYVLTNVGKKFGFKVATTAVTNIYGAEAKWDALADTEFDGIGQLVANKAVFDAKEDTTYTVEKCIFVTSSREDLSLDKTVLDARYAEYYDKHYAAYSEIFSAIDCKIEGDVTADGAIRFSNYHTIIAAAKNDAVHGLSAKGLTGEKYNNFVWWDSEIYQLPIYIYTMPEAAKQAIMYRYRMLDAARENAKLEGRSGARYAFCSSVLGDEKVWEYARHPFMQIHITADVAYGIIHYYTATGDEQFLKQYGLEIMTECCRYWVNRVEDTGDRYELKKMTGPDEHHPYVNNDAYTNYLVKEVFLKTAEYCEKYGKCGDELETWRSIAEKMYLPMEKSGLIPQFDGYFDLSRTLEEAGGGAAKSFQMKTSGLYNKSQIIKQPDVILLYTYLNFDLDKDGYAINWDYYEKMCESSSSLSFAPHAIAAADNGRMLSAYNYLLETAYIDIKDIHHCGWQGVHSGCAAGAWYAVFRGIGGVVCREDKIEINPHMMPWWKSLSFSFIYKGAKYNVVICDGKYTLSTADGKDTRVVFKGKDFVSKANQDLVFEI